MLVSVPALARPPRPMPPAAPARPACTTGMWSPTRDVLAFSRFCAPGAGAVASPQGPVTQLPTPALRTAALKAAVDAWVDGVGGRRQGPRPSIVAAVAATTDLGDVVALRRFFRQAEAATSGIRAATGWSPAFALVGEALDRRVLELL